MSAVRRARLYVCVIVCRSMCVCVGNLVSVCGNRAYYGDYPRTSRLPTTRNPSAAASRIAFALQGFRRALPVASTWAPFYWHSAGPQRAIRSLISQFADGFESN